MRKQVKEMSNSKTDKFIIWFDEEWKRITEKLNQYDLSHIKLVALEGK